MSTLKLDKSVVGSSYQGLLAESNKMKTLNQELETLQNKMKTFWESDESTAFHQGYDKFQKNLAELSTVVKSISDWAKTTKENYEENESKGAQFYGSIF